MKPHLYVSSTIPELIDEFCRRSDISPATREFYGKLKALLPPFCEEQGIARPEELTPDVVDALAARLELYRTARGKPLAPASRAAYLRAVRQFLSWLQKRKGIQGVDSTLVPMPRVRRQHRDVLSQPEIQKLEDAARIERDKLLIRLLAETGARLGEIASLRLDDLISRERSTFVRVRGKTGERLVPITHPTLYKRLKEYASGKTGRPRTRSPYLFMAHRRRPGADEYEALTEDGLYQAIKDAIQRADLGRRVHPHLLRHSALTHWLAERGANPIFVSALAGVSLQVIKEHYLHPTDEQMWQAMKAIRGD